MGVDEIDVSGRFSFLFLIPFAVLLPWDLLGDRELLFEDDDSLCGELDDIFRELLDALENFRWGDIDSLLKDSLCLLLDFHTFPAVFLDSETFQVRFVLL